MVTTLTPPTTPSALSPVLAEENSRLHDAWLATNAACYGDFGDQHQAAMSLEEKAWNTWLDFCLDNRIVSPGVQIGIMTQEQDPLY